jgi:hypothetical protein
MHQTASLPDAMGHATPAQAQSPTCATLANLERILLALPQQAASVIAIPGQTQTPATAQVATRHVQAAWDRGRSNARSAKTTRIWMAQRRPAAYASLDSHPTQMPVSA